MRALHSEEPGFTFDATPLLEVDDLRTEAAAGSAGETEALRGVSFSMSTTELLLYGVAMNTSGVTTSGKLTLGITT